MISFVVDMREGAQRLGAATPFLYPLQAKDRLRWIPARQPAGRSYPIENAWDDIRMHLLRTRAEKWQTIVLFDLPRGGSSPMEGALVEALCRIRATLLQPLKSMGLTPVKTWVIAMDALEREPHTNRPLDAMAELRWQLDRQGFVDHDEERFPVLFGAKDLDSIREAWDAPLGFPGGLPVDRFDRLPRDLQDEILGRWERATGRLRTLVENKKSALADALALPPSPAPAPAPGRVDGKERIDGHPGQGKPFHWITEALLDGIAEEFKARSSPSAQADIGRLLQFDPVPLLAQILRSNLSLERFKDEDLLLARFPFRKATDVELRFSHLKTAFLLTALADENLWEGLERDELYTASVELDREALGALLTRNRSQLYRPKRSASQPETEKQGRPGNWGKDECLCIGTFENDIKPFEHVLGYWNKPDDASLWKTWCLEAGESLALIREEASDLVDGCFESLHANPKELAAAEDDRGDVDLEKRLEAVEEELRKTRMGLLEDDAPPPPENDWEEKGEELIEQMRDWQECRPRPLHALLIFLAGLVAASALYRFPIEGETSFAACLIPWLGMAAVTAAAVWRSLAQLNDRLTEVKDQALRQATNSLKDIKEDFDRETKYVLTLCSAAALQKNLQELKTAVEREARWAKLDAYHKTKVDQHLKRIEETLEILNVNPGDPPESQESVSLDPEEPEQLNSIYAPATYRESSSDPNRCEINIRSSRRPCDSPLFAGMASLTVSKDGVYA